MFIDTIQMYKIYFDTNVTNVIKIIKYYVLTSNIKHYIKLLFYDHIMLIGTCG
jgi:hypothetical protein